MRAQAACFLTLAFLCMACGRPPAGAEASGESSDGTGSEGEAGDVEVTGGDGDDAASGDGDGDSAEGDLCESVRITGQFVFPDGEAPDAFGAFLLGPVDDEGFPNLDISLGADLSGTIDRDGSFLEPGRYIVQAGARYEPADPTNLVYRATAEIEACVDLELGELYMQRPEVAKPFTPGQADELVVDAGLTLLAPADAAGAIFEEPYLAGTRVPVAEMPALHFVEGEAEMLAYWSIGNLESDEFGDPLQISITGGFGGEAGTTLRVYEVTQYARALPVGEHFPELSAPNVIEVSAFHGIAVGIPMP